MVEDVTMTTNMTTDLSIPAAAVGTPAVVNMNRAEATIMGKTATIEALTKRDMASTSAKGSWAISLKCSAGIDRHLVWRPSRTLISS